MFSSSHFKLNRFNKGFSFLKSTIIAVMIKIAIVIMIAIIVSVTKFPLAYSSRNR